MKTTKGCTVKELREFLAKLPDEMAVAILEERHGGYETYTVFSPLELPADVDQCTDSVDVVGHTLYLGNR